MSKLEEHMFELIWQAIKGWDIEREPGQGYAHATGDDVRAVLDAIAPLLDAIDTLRWYADERNYMRVPASAMKAGIEYPEPPIFAGNRARAALAALERSDG